MNKNKFGEIVLDESDLVDSIMQGREVWNISKITVSRDIDIEEMIRYLNDPGQLITWTFPTDEDLAVSTFDHIQQGHWFMPDEYKKLDIAEYVLGLCTTQEQIQRTGQELLLYQEKDLFDLLRYLKYLVDVMKENNVIWGVGRGSSVASYVLYLLGVHRIDSMYYDLDPREFLR